MRENKTDHAEQAWRREAEDRLEGSELLHSVTRGDRGQALTGDGATGRGHPQLRGRSPPEKPAPPQEPEDTLGKRMWGSGAHGGSTGEERTQNTSQELRRRERPQHGRCAEDGAGRQGGQAGQDTA